MKLLIERIYNEFIRNQTPCPDWTGVHLCHTLAPRAGVSQPSMRLPEPHPVVPCRGQDDVSGTCF